MVGETSPVGRVAKPVGLVEFPKDWEGLWLQGEGKEKRQARTSTMVDLLAIYRYFSAVYMAILFI